MKRTEVNRQINKKADELRKKTGNSRQETLRQLVIAGIRTIPGENDFLRPYPSKEVSDG